VPVRGDRGLCQADAFKAGENRLPQVINCLNWSVEKEELIEGNRCPICRLHEIARLALKDNPTNEERKFLETLFRSSSLRINLKWNVIDRDNPFVTRIDRDGEVQIRGFKIATIGMDAYTDIEGIFEQCKSDITDVEEGIDVEIERGNNGTRTIYSARAVVDGKSLKVTPLTPEEKAMKPHDLKIICGRMIEPQRIIDFLHGDYRELLDINVDEDEGKTAKSVPIIAEKPSKMTDDSGGANDGDGLLDTSAQKKTPMKSAPRK